MAINAKINVYCIFECILTENRPKKFGMETFLWYFSICTTRLCKERPRKNPVLKKIISKNSENLKNCTFEWSKKNFSKKIKNAQNRSIRKVSWLKSIFQHPFQIPPITRQSEARIEKIFRPNFLFQKCSEYFNSCKKKHDFTILKKIS